MRKQIYSIMILAFLLVLAGCGLSAGQSGGGTPSENSPAQSDTGTGGSRSSGESKAYRIDESMKNRIQSVENNKELTDSMHQSSLINQGNTARIARAMKKAKAGKPLTVGFIGGSITAGSNAGKWENSYASLVADWFRVRFPDSNITYVNAGVGATGSIIGVHRVEEDLLSKNPDFVVVEFAVNDAEDIKTKEAYEGLVRRILQSADQPAVLLLFMAREDGSSAQITQESIGKHYSLPMVSYGDAVYPLVKNKKLEWSSLASDDVHPNDNGHKLAASMIVKYLSGLYDKLDRLDSEIQALPEPATPNRYMEAELLSYDKITPVSPGGFERTGDAFWQFKKGWAAKEKNKPLVFEVEAREISLLFKKTVNKKGGRVKVSVDGEYIETLDADFMNGWGDFAASYTVASFEQRGKHCVEILYIDEKADYSDGSEFILLGIMKS